jgi:mRNA interferase RelE/StbE
LTYQIIIERKADKEANTIPAKYRIAIDKEISALAFNPRPSNAKKLTDKEGYRIKVGDYRVLYTIDDKQKTIVIYRIKIRNEATYK